MLNGATFLRRDGDSATDAEASVNTEPEEEVIEEAEIIED